MYVKTLAEHVKAYLDLQAFLDECRADGLDTARATLATEQARREIRNALDASPRSQANEPFPQAIRAYLDAEHEFDKACAAAGELDFPARRMERARRDLQAELYAVAGEDPDLAPAATEPPEWPPATPRARRILVAYDQSAQAAYALDVAARIARDVNGRLLLVHVVQPTSIVTGDYASSMEALDTLHHQEADEMLARVRNGLGRSITSEQMVREGAPDVEILTAAKLFEADMIVMGTRARGRLAQFLLGSTAEAVVRRAACPVLTVSRRAPWASAPMAPAIGLPRATPQAVVHEL